MTTEPDNRPPQIIIYETDDKVARVSVRLEDETMPIRLLAKLSCRWVNPLPGIQFLVSRRDGAHDQSEH